MLGARILLFCVALCASGAARADALQDALAKCDAIDKLSTAITCYSDIVVQNPNSIDALDARASAYLDNGQYDLAIADLQRAIGLDPEDDLLYWALGIVYQDYGKYELAIYNFSKAIELYPDPAYYNERARSFALSGKASQGLPDINVALEEEPKNWNFLHVRGEIYEAMGELAKARADYVAALALKPDSPELKKHLAKLDAAAPTALPTKATYDLRLCNKSGDENVYAAIAVYDSGDAAQWTILAWYKIANGACQVVATREFGKYDKVDAAIYAESDDRNWSGSYALCLDPDNEYSRVNDANYRCQGNEQLFNFYTVTIPRDGASTVFTQTFTR